MIESPVAEGLLTNSGSVRNGLSIPDRYKCLFYPATCTVTSFTSLWPINSINGLIVPEGQLDGSRSEFLPLPLCSDQTSAADYIDLVGA